MRKLRRNRPRQNRNRRHRILRATLDDAITVDQINQGITRLIKEAHHLHGLEHQRGALLEHYIAIFELAVDANRPHLATGDGRLGTRSEERRVGQEWVSTCRSRWWASH